MWHIIHRIQYCLAIKKGWMNLENIMLKEAIYRAEGMDKVVECLPSKH
jgi:hypothetical protein